MSLVVVVVDIDGSMCIPQPGGTLEQWRRRIVEHPPDPLPVAQFALSQSIAAPLVVSTTRHGSLRTATRAWLDKHFPALRSAPLHMREGDDASEVEVRRGHIERVRGPSRVVLVDDTGDMKLALRDGDHFIRAPRDWKWLGAIVATASR